VQPNERCLTEWVACQAHFRTESGFAADGIADGIADDQQWYDQNDTVDSYRILGKTAERRNL